MGTHPARDSRTLAAILGGLATGGLAAGLVLGFRWVVERTQAGFLPGGELGAYEALPPWLRLILPILGGLVLGAAFSRFPRRYTDVGIVHVLKRLREGHRLPAPNLLTQFLAGSTAIVAGLSVDREGPGVHIGAAVGSLFGRLIDLPDRATLTACGAAASIAAAFNTPLAGILFVMEVLEVRYTPERFLPVMLASATGAVLGRLAYGSNPAFAVPLPGPLPLAALGWMLLLGPLAGLIAGGFIALIEYLQARTTDWGFPTAFTLAGAVTGLLALGAPQIMGISYDTLTRILAQGLPLGVLLTVLAAKFAATAACIGLRVPGGLIGPSLVIGGALGGTLGVLVTGGGTAAYAFYPLAGMMAMMGATLQAPLAALSALLELTGRVELILPGTLSILGADLVSRILLGRESVFATLAGLGQGER